MSEVRIIDNEENKEISQKKKIVIISVCTAMFIVMIVQVICYFYSTDEICNILGFVSFIPKLIAMIILLKSKEEINAQMSKYYFYALSLTVVVAVLINFFV